MCISDDTECETPLLKEKKAGQNKEIRAKRCKKKRVLFYLTLHLSTSSCQDPCPAAQLAPSSSPLIPSASAPQFSSAAPALYKPVARTKRYEKQQEKVRTDNKRRHGVTKSIYQKQEVLSRGFFRWDIRLCGRRAHFFLSEFVGRLSLLLQLWEALAADLLSSQTAFFSSQLQTDTFRNPQSCFGAQLQFNT